MSRDGEAPPVFLNPPQFSIERMDALEQQVRDLKESRREDVARVAALALTVGNQTQVLRSIGKALEAIGGEADIAKKRIDLNVDCIQKLNNVAATLGEGYQVA